MTTAWHLRQDGLAVPVQFHLYVMQDSDLSSEAEIASLMINTNSKDLGIANYVIDAWCALLADDIVETLDDNVDDLIIQSVNSYLSDIPFVSRLTDDQILEIHHNQLNYTTVSAMYDFIAYVKSNIKSTWKSISESFNQQFCRVRFGGEYESALGNPTMWFRVSSIGFNWSNTIYIWISKVYKKLHVRYITICRDEESDRGYVEGGNEQFYLAKDGQPYHHMLLDEFLSAGHESNPIFSSDDFSLSAGCITYMWESLNQGYTLAQAISRICATSTPATRNISKWDYYLRDEILRNCCQK